MVIGYLPLIVPGDGRMRGNRITSRIDRLLVMIITSRSMPMPFAAGRRQSVLEGTNVVLVHPMRFRVTGRPLGELRLEPPPLLGRDR